MINGKIIKVCGMREAQNLFSIPNLPVISTNFLPTCLLMPAVSEFL